MVCTRHENKTLPLEAAADAPAQIQAFGVLFAPAARENIQFSSSDYVQYKHYFMVCNVLIFWHAKMGGEYSCPSPQKVPPPVATPMFLCEF